MSLEVLTFNSLDHQLFLELDTPIVSPPLGPQHSPYVMQPLSKVGSIGSLVFDTINTNTYTKCQ